MPNLPKKYTWDKPYTYVQWMYPRRMILYWEDGKKKTTSYARWLYETQVGPIPKGKTIHHINEDKMDDRVENYQLLTHSEHTTHHKTRRTK